MKIKRNKIFTLFNFVLFTLLLLAFLVRVYRIDSLLGFYFDQGRDANVIWDLWHQGKFFLPIEFDNTVTCGRRARIYA